MGAKNNKRGFYPPPIVIPRVAAPKSTRQQRALLKAWNEAIKRTGVQPSYKELSKDLGYESRATIAYHVASLRKAGYLAPSTGKCRALELTAVGQKLLEVQ